ncbi:MAG: DUF4384 domain-containing protein [Proteobacteria bacterium]|nr:DUF4384 domain-containing protein [Pseudomonadota bacterium]MCP4918598.1 DUF4384 domain-containing protein [Pseudomonadota bacterium]
MSESVFTRDGHVLELALERYVLDELESGHAELVDLHVAECETCAASLTAIHEDDTAMPAFWARIDLSGDTDLGDIEPANDPQGVTIPPWKKITPILGLLAAALLIGLLLPTGPEFEARGGEVELQVYRHDGEQGAPVFDGDVVHPGERLGFRLASGRGGHAMVVGVDDAGTIYPCWPQPEGVSVLLDPMTEPTTLPTAVRLDDMLGSERIVAVVCDDAFTFGHVADAIAEDVLLDGCETAEIELLKEPL